MQQAFDIAILGAGRRGLGAALEARRQRPEARLVVIEAAPQPGGSIRTQRSNGFVCELGPFAFDPAEIEPSLALLSRPPAPVRCATTAGHVFTGSGLVAAPVEPSPVSFAAGCEELVQAYRRELGPHLLLGRRVTGLAPEAAAWRIELGGEAATTLECTEVVLATPVRESARLLGALDRELPPVAARITDETGAYAFFGGHGSDAPELTGYGIVPGDGVVSPLVEAIFCHAAFANRALPGRFLVRCELRGALLADGDPALLDAAAAELRRWTGTRARFPFTKLHRFATASDGAPAVECEVRLRGLTTRMRGLSLAPARG